MNKLNELYELLFVLRNKQSECNISERQAIQEEIKAVLSQIDQLEKDNQNEK